MNRQAVSLPLRSPVTDTSYNEANQMLRYNASSDNISYDENGNMTSITNSCGATNYTWDVRNRLVGINGFKPDCSSLTASFKYDALDRRIEKTINGETIQYLYDWIDIVQEIKNGQATANYIGTLSIDEPLARIQSDGIVRYYQQDALGSIIALTDENGNIKTTYSYDPFGNVTVTGEASDNPFQYTGRENDNTGLYYYRARYYSPELQRFISEDPLRLREGSNFYHYVWNNPVLFLDPTGEKCQPGASSSQVYASWSDISKKYIPIEIMLYAVISSEVRIEDDCGKCEEICIYTVYKKVRYGTEQKDGTIKWGKWLGHWYQQMIIIKQPCS
jgi:RHS repeat-associated protein